MTRSLVMLLTALMLVALASGCPRGTRLEPPSAQPAPPPAPMPPPEEGTDELRGKGEEAVPGGTSAFGEEPIEEVGEGRAIEPLARVAERANEEGVLETVYFEFDSAALTDSALAKLDQNAAWLRENEEMHVVVEGHTDERGTAEYNIALGSRRANALRDHLIRLGVEGERIRTISFGEERPAARGSGEQAWRQNRRGEFVVELP